MSRPAGKKILVVEDEADILHLVTHYLEKEGFRLRTAGTGVQALKLVKEDRPDLIILDLMLPELDGLRSARKSG
jgi:two-component system alkaline phosphatase synthesis response regulator PhoP